MNLHSVFQKDFIMIPSPPVNSTQGEVFSQQLGLVSHDDTCLWPLPKIIPSVHPQIFGHNMPATGGALFRRWKDGS